jgi:hypothetical protein
MRVDLRPVVIIQSSKPIRRSNHLEVSAGETLPAGRRCHSAGGALPGLNAVVVGVGLAQIVATPQLIGSWTQALTAQGTGFLDIAGPAIIAFPLLVLGLSGFGTGVSMMPLVAATGTDPRYPLGTGTGVQLPGGRAWCRGGQPC